MEGDGGRDEARGWWRVAAWSTLDTVRVVTVENRPQPGNATPRVDQWLWSVRITKTRADAAELCRSGHVKVNGKTVKPAAKLVVGDRIETRVHQLERVVVVTKLISKRVGAAVAIECFDDRSPPPPERSLAPPVFERDRGAGRPTKRDRRRLDELRGRSDRTR